MVKTSTFAVILGVMILSVFVFADEAEAGGLVKRAISTAGTWLVSDIPDLPASKITSGTFPKTMIGSSGTFSWSEISKTGSSIHDLANVTSVGCAVGQVLKVSGTTWQCAADSGLTSAITSINADTTATQTIVGVVGNTTASTTSGVTTINLGNNVLFTSLTQTISSKTIDADSNTITNIDNNEIKIDATKLVDGSVTSTELQYINTLSSNAQTQIDGKISLTRINGNSGSAGSDITWQKLSANSAGLTSTTPAVVMTTTGVGVGTWHFKYLIIFQSAATTTGIKVSVNHSGTTSLFQLSSDYVTTGTTAATGIHDGISTVAAAGLHEGTAERVINTSSKATVGVATANANQMMTVEGVVVVTSTGQLELKIGTEINASAITVQADSLLELTKIG